MRELENLVVQAILFSSSDTLRPQDLKQTKGPANNTGSAHLPDLCAMDYKPAKEKMLQEFNRRYIGTLLRDTGGNVTRAAQLCGMERQALQQVMRRYGISAKDFRHP